MINIIIAMLLLVSLLNAKTVFEKYGISIGNGKYIGININWDGSCYNLVVAGDAHGSASNCSKNINNYWALGGGCGSITGGVEDVVNKILQCTR